MAFHEVVFPYSFRYDMTIKHRYRTTIVTTKSFHEERNCDWLDCLRLYNLTPVLFGKEEFTTLGEFFRARRGREHGFRLLDPIDNNIDNQFIGSGNGVRHEWQIYKSYATGLAGDTYTAKRIITKVFDFDEITVNGIARTFPIVNENTGVIRFSLSLTNISMTFGPLGVDNKITRNDAGNFGDDDVRVGDTIRIVGSVNYDNFYIVSSLADGGTSLVVTGNPFTSSETSSVLMHIPPPSGHSVAISCGFHVPVFFNMRRLGTTLRTFEDFNPEGIEIVEQRIAPELYSNLNFSEDPIPEFVEALFPIHLQSSDDSEFASSYPDDLIIFDSGFEKRVTRSQQGYDDFIVRYDVRSLQDIENVVTMYHCRKGRFGGFRVVNMNDFDVTMEVLGEGDGETYEFQMIKRYESGGEVEERNITKPVEGTLTIYEDSNPISLLSANIDVDYTRGKVTFKLNTLLSLTFVSGDNTITRSSGLWADDDIVVGMKVVFSGTEFHDGDVFTISVVDDDTITVEEALQDETALDVTVYLPPLTGVLFEYSVEFHTPVRFNTDELEIQINGFESYSINNLNLQEIHQEPVEAIYFTKPLITAGPLICAASPSSLLSPPEVGLDFRDTGNFVPTYSDVFPITNDEIHRTLNRITGWTFFAVFSHSRRGVLLDIPQYCNRVEFTPNGLSDLGIRVLFSPSMTANRANIEVHTWCGSAPIDINTFTGVCFPYEHYLMPHHIFSKSLYTHPPTEDYEPVSVVIVSYSYLSNTCYLSGTASGRVHSTFVADADFVTFTCAPHGGANGAPVVLRTPVDRYVANLERDVQNGSMGGASSIGSYKGSGLAPGPGPSPFSGILYELYWAQYYRAFSDTEEAIYLKAIHGYIMDVLERKYIHQRKTSLALEGTRGHFVSESKYLYTWTGGVAPSLPPSSLAGYRLAELGDPVSKWNPSGNFPLYLINGYGPGSLSPQGYAPTLIAVDPDNPPVLTDRLYGWWE